MLKHMSVMHPAAKMLVDLSAAQDVEAGDGTTSVVVIAGSLLAAADRLLAKGEKRLLCAQAMAKPRRHSPHNHIRVVPTSSIRSSRNPRQHVTSHIAL